MAGPPAASFHAAGCPTHGGRDVLLPTARQARQHVLAEAIVSQASPDGSDRRRATPSPAAAQRWVLALASLASFLVILDALVVATALTAIQRHLGSSLSDLEWTVNAYTLSFAVFLMTAAALGDRLGRRRVFAAGLALFAIASAACGLAPDTGALIAARTVQGIGAAAIMPTALALLNGAIPAQRRGWALGLARPFYWLPRGCIAHEVIRAISFR